MSFVEIQCARYGPIVSYTMDSSFCTSRSSQSSNQLFFLDDEHLHAF